MRYSHTERLGVIETDSIITKKLGWIFREQPIVDVGIDAIIEKAESGEPKGKFIAVQIKSGEKNFYIKENSLTYYLSNIHYNYWLNLNIPIILVAYLPKTDDCYWQIINESTLKATKNKWKITIPKSNLLSKSKTTISKLLVERDSNSIFTDLYDCDSEYALSEEADFLVESIAITARMNELHNEFGLKIKQYKLKINQLIAKGFTSKDHQLKVTVKKQSVYLTTISYRFINEIKLFSEIFPQELYCLEKSICSYSTNGALPEEIKDGFKKTEKILEERAVQVRELHEISETINSKVTKPYPTMKKAKKALIEAFETMSYEYEAASIIVKKVGHP